jgi:predicted PurR-regulated permease PerM
MTSGIIGLFVGAIIFALGYKLFLAWLNEETQPEREPSKSEWRPSGEAASAYRNFS